MLHVRVHALLSAKLNFAAVDTPDRKGFEVYVVQTPYVNGPTVKGQHPFFQLLWRRIARPSEREDAACWAKVVHRRSRAPLIADQVFPWSQQSKAFSWNAMNKRTSATTDGAVARSNVIDFRIDLELDLAAMAAPAVGFHSA